MRFLEPSRRRIRARDVDPLLFLRVVLTVLGRALTRLWGRDVMLYNGGVSFFVMLAIFPAIAIVMGIITMIVAYVVQRLGIKEKKA